MPEQELCKAKHPTIKGVTCLRQKGPNARTPDVVKVKDGQVEVDKDGNPIVKTPGHDVHVHRGQDANSGVHRWEDES